MLEDLDIRALLAELLGTALLVLVGVGVATLSFGFDAAGSSTAAGVVATALAFGLVLLVLAHALGPVSGCHVNPAVTLGFVLAGRMRLRDAVGYWVAQLAGGLAGALVLWTVVQSSSAYRDRMGLGANGFGPLSMVGLSAWGALLVETVLTFLFVLTVLAVTRAAAPPLAAGTAIGVALAVVHLVGIPLTGTSVNPARSLGPALFVGDLALSQLWLFFVAPLLGGALAALAHEYFFPPAPPVPPQETITLPEGTRERAPAGA